MKNNFLTKLSAVALAGVMALTFAPAASLTAFAADTATTATEEAKTATVYRAYNTKNGEHLLTVDKDEYDWNVKLGLKAEGEQWTAPTTGDPVYRVYNRHTGEHLLIYDKSEYDYLVSVGWDGEGVKMYSDTNKTIPVYRVYNPNAKDAGTHLYTANKDEYDALVNLTWKGEGVQFYAVSAPAEQGTLTAKQTGASSIQAVSSIKLDAKDKITLKKGSTEQAITTALSEDGKTISITTGSKLSDGDYVVTVTPANAQVKPFEAKLTAEKEKLAGLNFGKEFVLVSNKNFYTVQTTITGSNQWKEDFNLGSGEVNVYPSVAKVAEKTPSTNGTIEGKSYYTGYSVKDKTYTLVKEGSIPFKIGDEVTLTAIYKNGATVVQDNATIPVSDAAYVAKMTFSEKLLTKNATLKDKRVTLDNFNEGSYYLTVEAEDQYQNKLTADQLQNLYGTKMLFLNPTSDQGAYGGVDEGDGPFEELDDGTIALNVNGKSDKTTLPGKAILSVAGVGGLSTSTTFEVFDNPYIDQLDVEVPSDLYQSTKVELKATAKDQYGDDFDLYTWYTKRKKPTTKTEDATVNEIDFNDVNGLTKSKSYIKVDKSSTLKPVIKSATKQVIFEYTPGAALTTDVLTIADATPDVVTRTLTIGKTGVPAGIQKKLMNKDMTVDYGTATFDFAGNYGVTKGLVFTDTNGEPITRATDAAGAAQLPTFTDYIDYTGQKRTSGASVHALTLPSDSSYSNYYYTIYCDKNKEHPATDPAAVSLNSGAAGTYKFFVNLYAYDYDGKIRTIDSKPFTVTVAEAYDADHDTFTASVAEGDELLFNATDQDDSAKIVVKRTDKAGHVVDITGEKGFYKLTVDKGLSVDQSTDDDDSSKDYSLIKRSASAKKSDSNGSESTANVTVWKNSAVIAETTLKYSNKPQSPKKESWTKILSLDDSVELPADDSVDVTASDATYAINDGVFTITKDGSGFNEKLSVKDQYGLDMDSTTFTVNGAKVTDATAKIKCNFTNTVIADNGDVTKTVKVVVPGGVVDKTIAFTAPNKTLSNEVPANDSATFKDLATTETQRTVVASGVLTVDSLYALSTNVKVADGTTLIFAKNDATQTGLNANGHKITFEGNTYVVVNDNKPVNAPGDVLTDTEGGAIIKGNSVGDVSATNLTVTVASGEGLILDKVSADELTKKGDGDLYIDGGKYRDSTIVWEKGSLILAGTITNKNGEYVININNKTSKEVVTTSAETTYAVTVGAKVPETVKKVRPAAAYDLSDVAGLTASQKAAMVLPAGISYDTSNGAITNSSGLLEAEPGAVVNGVVLTNADGNTTDPIIVSTGTSQAGVGAASAKHDVIKTEKSTGKEAPVVSKSTDIAAAKTAASSDSQTNDTYSIPEGGVKTFQQLKTALETEGTASVKLAADITAAEALKVTKDFSINLNGHSITWPTVVRTEDQDVQGIRVKGASLTVNGKGTLAVDDTLDAVIYAYSENDEAVHSITVGPEVSLVNPSGRAVQTCTFNENKSANSGKFTVDIVGTVDALYDYTDWTYGGGDTKEDTKAVVNNLARADYYDAKFATQAGVTSDGKGHATIDDAHNANAFTAIEFNGAGKGLWGYAVSYKLNAEKKAAHDSQNSSTKTNTEGAGTES